MTNFLIVGCARNVERVIENEVSNLDRCFGPHGELSYFIVESDSADRTLNVLHKISETRKSFKYISLGRLSTASPDRHERMALCRNSYLEEIRTRVRKLKIDFVVVADLDGVNRDLTPDSVASCFTRDDWDACFANQGRNYYDVFALRHETWCPEDPWREMWQLREQGTKDLKSKEIAIHRKQRHISPNSDWIRVDSAFGGLAIYRTEVMLSSRYSAYPKSQSLSTCEHVAFHLENSKKNLNFFINPKLINSKWNDHNKIHKHLPTLRRKLALAKESLFA
jgi:uncharacterized protein YnzC (UPF0291/DUF896 family)